MDEIGLFLLGQAFRDHQIRPEAEDAVLETGLSNNHAAAAARGCSSSSQFSQVLVDIHFGQQVNQDGHLGQGDLREKLDLSANYNKVVLQHNQVKKTELANGDSE